LYADARYEKVGEAGQVVRDAAVLVATESSPEGERQVLGASEHETHWKVFLKGLRDRGMNSVKLVISDDHVGLGAVRRAVLGSLPW
jgi:transposase-like protein